MTPKTYRELLVWQKAMDLTEHVYRTSESWPKTEIYGLTVQIRRAAVSVPSNIAEGQGRRTPRQFMHFLSIAYGSLMEVETALQLASRFGYSNQGAVQEGLRRSEEVGRLLNGLKRSLKASVAADVRHVPPPKADD